MQSGVRQCSFYGQHIDDTIFSLVDSTTAGAFYVFASFTVAYHVAFFARLSFMTLLFLACGLSIGLLAIFSRNLEDYYKVLRRTLRTSFSISLAVLMLISIGAVLALFTIRPDPDDGDYLSISVLNAYHWADPLLRHYPLAFVTIPDFVGTHSLPSLTHFCALISTISGTSPVEIFHYLIPVIGGALIPAAWFSLLRRFVGSSWSSLFGAATVMLVLCLDGTVHRSFGNFAFVRIWQGKALVMTVMTPIVVAHILDALNSTGHRNLIRLSTLGISAFGLSMMSIHYLFFIAMAVIGSTKLIFWRRIPLGRMLSCGLSLIWYPLLIMIPSYPSMIAHLGQLPSEKGWPVRIYDVLEFVFGNVLNVTLWAGMGALVCLALLRRWKILSWIGFWAAIIAFPLLVPRGSTWVAQNLTSRDHLWRLMYALPLLPTIGLAAASLFSQARRKYSCPLWFGMIGASMLVSAAGFFPESPSPWSKSNVLFGQLGLKIDPATVRLCKKIEATLSSGTMLAPEEISTWLPALTPHFIQGNVRSGTIFSTGLLRYDRTAAEQRFWAHGFVGGLNTEEAFFSFSKELRFPYDYVILKAEVACRPEVVIELRSSNFERVDGLEPPFVIYERNGRHYR